MSKKLKQEFLEELSAYLRYLNHLLTSSLKIKALTDIRDLENLDLAIDNRERLIKIIQVYKAKIGTKLDKKDRLNLGPDFFHNFEKVEKDIQIFFGFIKKIDEQAISGLNQEKNEMAKQASSFSKIKSYLKAI
ncbi:MAG: hypothetical protein DRQ88_05155 [Epsilonproteobacteria bacterium]|nr:MAG: hypothetical protein DRQ89_04600 [Campylobacterota bacterium]RLA66816.1 MAG: hypothetical protein DRQ88_05155 [Campylobacterota bacterium]